MQLKKAGSIEASRQMKVDDQNSGLSAAGLMTMP